MLVVSNEESFFPYCARAFPPNALEHRITWDKADKETEDLKLSSIKGHFPCPYFAQSCESPKTGTKYTARAQRCLLN